MAIWRMFWYRKADRIIRGDRCNRWCNGQRLISQATSIALVRNLGRCVRDAEVAGSNPVAPIDRAGCQKLTIGPFSCHGRTLRFRPDNTVDPPPQPRFCHQLPIIVHQSQELVQPVVQREVNEKPLTSAALRFTRKPGSESARAFVVSSCHQRLTAIPACPAALSGSRRFVHGAIATAGVSLGVRTNRPRTLAVSV